MIAQDIKSVLIVVQKFFNRDDDGDDDDDDDDDGDDENNYYFYNYSTNIFNKNERFNVVVLPKRLQWNFNFLTHLHWTR